MCCKELVYVVVRAGWGSLKSIEQAIRKGRADSRKGWVFLLTGGIYLFIFSAFETLLLTVAGH